MSPLPALLVATLALAVAGCGGRLERAPESSATPATRPNAAEPEPSEALPEGGFSSEAERTRAMEAQADDLKRQFDDALAGATTEEEKIRAYQEFEQGRQELNEMSEAGADDSDAYGPPPSL